MKSCNKLFKNNKKNFFKFNSLRKYSVDWNAKQLRVDTINPNVLNTAYAVRGEMVIRALDIDRRLKSGEKFPFSEIVFCNIGNPQELGQKPITFYRQVMSLLEYPEMMNDNSFASKFPSDALKRAREIASNIPGGVGAYSHSQGLPIIRKYVADFITRRDGFPADPESIFLTDGASPGVQLLLKIMIRNAKDGVMIPIPQYPLYSATIPLVGGSPVSYYLNEETGWGLDTRELDSSYENAVKSGIIPRGLVVINPGNPTGQCLDVSNMEQVVDFCKRRNVVLFADEVYQENIYNDSKRPFTSFKKVVKKLGPKYESVELVSFHSISKGVTGECGQRGGYFELSGVSPAVVEQIYKIASINLCPNVPGQVLMGLMTNPPTPGEPSYDTWKNETDNIYNSLRRRAEKVVQTLNKLEGITCNPVEGALYAFPSVKLPPKAIEAAKKEGRNPDLFYTIKLLENTGLVTVPGVGFGQKDGTFHFRTTILPLEEKIAAVLQRFEKFHQQFMQQYK